MTARYMYPFPACSVPSFIHIFLIIGVAFDLPAYTPCLPHAVGSRRGLTGGRIVLVAPLVLAILHSGLLVSTRRRLMLLLMLQRSFSMFLGRSLPMPVPPLPPPVVITAPPVPPVDPALLALQEEARQARLARNTHEAAFAEREEMERLRVQIAGDRLAIGSPRPNSATSPTTPPVPVHAVQSLPGPQNQPFAAQQPFFPPQANI